MAEDRINYRDEIAGEIIRAIEAGTAPWQRPWKPNEIGARPFNPLSGKPYRGINDLWLSLRGHADPRWMTYRQALELGGQVLKGAKATTIEYWQWTERKPALGEDGKPLVDVDGNRQYVETRLDRPRVFYAKVFNASQIAGLEPWIAPAPTFDPIERAEALLAGCTIPIFHDQADRAFYSPWADQIHLNPRADFKDAAAYYGTALHEVGHGTGHESRLAREFGPFGSEVYAREELRAEISSYMLARDLGIGHDPSRHAAYVESWLKALKEDRNEIFRAARDAEEIKTWVMEPERRPELERNAQARVAAAQAEEHGMTETPAVRVYFSVPFSERDAVKAAGARWDGDAKRWYVPEGKYPAAFVQWADRPKEAKPERATAPADRAPAATKPEPAKRIFLAVPFAEKNEAKALGAQWSKRDKSWWVPEGTDLAPFEKWTPGTAKAAAADLSPVAEFGDALRAHGLLLEGVPAMDGKWHRVQVEGDRAGQFSGSYVGFLPQTENERPAGLITNWKAGVTADKWVAAGAMLSAEQKAELQAQAAQIRTQRETDRRQAAEVAARKAYGVWANLPDGATPETCAYLAAKGVEGHGVKVAQDGHLVVPQRDADGRLWGVQFCSAEGKRYMKGNLHTGTMHVIEPSGKGTLDAITPAMGGTIVIAEGYATAATIHEATGRPVVVAFDSGNLQAVVRAVKERHPERELLIAADNDHAVILGGKPVNVGMVKAEAVAKTTGALWTAPRFSDDEKASKLTDFNDLAASRGKSAVKAAIDAALTRNRAEELERGIA
jgi:putative DNA primase/helicase